MDDCNSEYGPEMTCDECDKYGAWVTITRTDTEVSVSRLCFEHHQKHAKRDGKA